jgi:hypothetical protein
MKKLWTLAAALFVVCVVAAGLAWQSYAQDEEPQRPEELQVPVNPPQGPPVVQRPQQPGVLPQVPRDGLRASPNPVMLLDHGTLYVLIGDVLYKVNTDPFRVAGAVVLRPPQQRLNIPRRLEEEGGES